MLFDVICRRVCCLLSLRYPGSAYPDQRRSFQPHLDRICVSLQRQQRGKAVATAYVRPMELLRGNEIELDDIYADQLNFTCSSYKTPLVVSSICCQH